MEQVKEHKWSLDACVGYARLHKLFSAEEMVCTHTLYNEVWAGSLDLSVTELPEAMKRKAQGLSPVNTRRTSAQTFLRGLRSQLCASREGHWEGDTVVGKRAVSEAVVLSLLEKTENYIAIRIPGKDADSVSERHAVTQGRIREKFSQVFKTITVDNGSGSLRSVRSRTGAVQSTLRIHYTSWERPQNERHNGLFRAFVPKGVSIEAFSAEYILCS